MDCIDLFKRAAMALQTDPRYVILDQARKANDKNEELQNLIGEFNLARMDLNNEIGKDKLSRYTANIAFAGFTAPKLLWMRENEPDNFARIEKIMLPKDYINYKLTGVHCTDYSDASGMLLLDVEHKCWLSLIHI